MNTFPAILPGPFRHRVPLLAATLVVSSACVGDTPSEATAVVTDSAGVEIVTNPTFDAPEWTVSADPLLELGTVEEEGPEQFFRLWGALRAELNGEELLLVSNGGSGEIRIFDLEGDYLRTIGRQGAGPGELGMPGPLWLLEGDSIAVWDLRSDQLVVYSSEGVYGRTVTARGIPNAAVVGVESDGHLLMTSEIYALSPEPGFEMMEVALFRIGPEGERIDTLAREPLARMGRVEGFDFVGQTLFGSRTAIAGDDRGYWVVTGQEPRVRRHAPDGRLLRIAQWPAGNREVPAEAVDQALRDELDAAPEERHPAIRRLHEARPVAERLPTTGYAVAGHRGEVWLEEIEWPPTEGVTTWKVVSAEGRLVGEVELPDFSTRRFVPLDIGEDWIIGAYRDDLGVEYLRMYGLERSGS